MGSTEENHDAEISVPEFSFDEWANELGLKRPITQELRKEELVTKEALSLVELKDLKELNFPLGVIKIIMNAISKWNITRKDMALSAISMNSALADKEFVLSLHHKLHVSTCINKPNDVHKHNQSIIHSINQSFLHKQQ